MAILWNTLVVFAVEGIPRSASYCCGHVFAAFVPPPPHPNPDPDPFNLTCLSYTFPKGFEFSKYNERASAKGEVEKLFAFWEGELCQNLTKLCQSFRNLEMLSHKKILICYIHALSYALSNTTFYFGSRNTNPPGFPVRILFYVGLCFKKEIIANLHL